MEVLQEKKIQKEEEKRQPITRGIGNERKAKQPQAKGPKMTACRDWGNINRRSRIFNSCGFQHGVCMGVYELCTKMHVWCMHVPRRNSIIAGSVVCHDLVSKASEQNGQSRGPRSLKPISSLRRPWGVNAVSRPGPIHRCACASLEDAAIPSPGKKDNLRGGDLKL